MKTPPQFLSDQAPAAYTVTHKAHRRSDLKAVRRFALEISCSCWCAIFGAAVLLEGLYFVYIDMLDHYFANVWHWEVVALNFITASTSAMLIYARLAHSGYRSFREVNTQPAAERFDFRAPAPDNESGRQLIINRRAEPMRQPDIHAGTFKVSRRLFAKLQAEEEGPHRGRSGLSGVHFQDMIKEMNRVGYIEPKGKRPQSGYRWTHRGRIWLMSQG